MDLKTEIKKLLEAYGCLQTHKGEPFNEIYDQIRDEDLVNDLFALYGVVFNEAKEIDKQLKSEHNEYIMKANEKVWLYSEVELPNKCKVCGRTDEERLTMTSMCGVSACPY